MMKTLFLTLLCLHQTALWAQDICSNVPSHLSCQQVVAPQPLKEVSGRCAGLLNGRYVCIVNFQTSSLESSMDVNCTSFLGRPFFVEKLTAKVLTYKMIGVVDQEDGEQTILQDQILYTTLANDQMNIGLQEDASSLITQRRATMHLAVFGAMRSLENVSCE
jgi:hypothetical protein